MPLRARFHPVHAGPRLSGESRLRHSRLRGHHGEAAGTRRRADRQRHRARCELRRQPHRGPAHRRARCRLRRGPGGAQRNVGGHPRRRGLRGRAAYMLAYTVVTGDYPVLERNVEDPRDAGASADADVAARVSALQRRVEILGVVGRECFAPRMTFVLRDGPGVTGEYEGRELMWDFARDARELRRFLPGLPILPPRTDELVAAIAGLDASASVDAVLRLTLATKGEQPA